MWVHHDGGRAAAGFSGRAPGDCATRAAAIASGRDYRWVYDRINQIARTHERRGKRKGDISNARTGVHKATMKRLMFELGADWVPTMTIGSGCQLHVAMNELPIGRLVLSLSRHYAAIVDQ